MFWLGLLLLCHLVIPEALRADNLPASSFFQAGQKSFQAQDYEQALGLFKQAQAAGLDKPALFYNIGVCAYKLGHYEEATKAFLHTATFPKMAALAYYNLAVVAEKQDDQDAALSWLHKVTTTEPRDEKLVLLAQTALSRIRSRQELSGQWTRYVALDFGYDDNVALVDYDDLGLTSDEEDSFTDIFAFIRSPLLGKSASQGPYLQGSLSWRDYTKLHEYDSGSLQMEGRYRKNAKGFRLESGAGYSYLSWDGAGYSQSPLFSLHAKHSLGDASSYGLHYEAKYYDILDSDYDYQRGWQHRASADFITQSELYRLLIGYSLEENDRHDKESSPRRHLLHAAFELHLIDHLAITVAASYRDSNYDPSGIDDRNEDRYEMSLRLGYSLSNHWELTALASRTINISTAPLYDYRRTMTSLSLGYNF
ncbi:MAG: hypothetical protein KKD73_10685 [Proteobacteria bacterium]|nr:hypothetical protein [Pseudomonadota bacterium]MBU1641147.1 hypothetical protein [Pseudomonadota bacterium]